ncbi:MAG: universal stress protein [Nitrospinota bacterium]|nr:MAG: universal stress protein [Nitrospinota bacterium]
MSLTIERILVPTDFSPDADHAMHYAATLAKDVGAELFIMHVLPEEEGLLPFSRGEIQEMYDYPLDYPLDQIFDDLKKVVERRFAAIVTEETKRGIRIRPLIYSGKPAQEIVQAAMLHDIDLIVIATHGRTGLAHVLLGSVAEKVVRFAPCPVLTIKHPDRVQGNQRKQAL